MLIFLNIILIKIKTIIIKKVIILRPDCTNELTSQSTSNAYIKLEKGGDIIEKKTIFLYKLF